MQSAMRFLFEVHDAVHDFSMKLNYNEPKIFTGGVKVSEWSKLSKKEQKDALKKDWYVYYSYRDPETGKLTRQTNLKGDANFQKTKRNRLKILTQIKATLEKVLEAGYNPYAEDNSKVKDRLLSKEPKVVEMARVEAKTDSRNNDHKIAPEISNKVTEVAASKANHKVEGIQEEAENVMTLGEAFKLGLETKQKVLNATSYPKFKSRINRLKSWLQENGITEESSINLVTKKIVINYLNDVLQRTSPRNRNNARVDLSSLFQVLEDNEVIAGNFVKKINVLSAKPIRNKTYKPQENKEIYAYLEKEDPILSLFIKFVSYNFLRPIEVCRLKVKDLDVEDKKLYVKAKNKPVKTKIIPAKLLKDLPDLTKMDRNSFLFTPDRIGGEWDTTEVNKRDYFTKRFKKVKDHFGLDGNYGLYSFRHTFITMLYRELKKNFSTYETKSQLMLITGHSTMEALEKYLRDIDAELPKDYSNLIKV
ncbi:site-specific integrase [Mangrovimonas sp. TPBH4]|uniref:tyrosine-type recombinase/integrase n=1 Tax=Mangrovimonas sp. TPBH4 TaxID=1645914 RepID=UPI0006B4F9A3|nr:site-specific integrase [Mangrovimonas sp. TPBH4]